MLNILILSKFLVLKYNNKEFKLGKFKKLICILLEK